MKIVIWTDEQGYKHRSLVFEGDAPENGIYQDPPDLERLDWEEIKRELHNLLLERGLITWRDVQASHNGVSAALQHVLKRRLIDLYKLQEKQEGVFNE